MRPFDPRYPRLLTRSQAEARHFWEALGERTVRGVEAVMNGRVERDPEIPPLEIGRVRYERFMRELRTIRRGSALDPNYEGRSPYRCSVCGLTGHRCEACGVTTYGYSLACGGCGRARG